MDTVEDFRKRVLSAAHFRSTNGTLNVDIQSLNQFSLQCKP